MWIARLPPPSTLGTERKIPNMNIYKQSECAYCRTTFPYRSNKIFCSRKCKEDNRRYPYKKYKKDSCEKCGFIAEHRAQLDVDHIDGNHQNNDPSNLQTLCANCHRLKTVLNEDHLA